MGSHRGGRCIKCMRQDQGRGIKVEELVGLCGGVGAGGASASEAKEAGVELVGGTMGTAGTGWVRVAPVAETRERGLRGAVRRWLDHWKKLETSEKISNERRREPLIRAQIYFGRAGLDLLMEQVYKGLVWRLQSGILSPGYS